MSRLTYLETLIFSIENEIFSVAIFVLIFRLPFWRGGGQKSFFDKNGRIFKYENYVKSLTRSWQVKSIALEALGKKVFILYLGSTSYLLRERE